MFEAKVLLQKSILKLTQEIVYFHFGKNPQFIRLIQYGLQPTSFFRPFLTPLLKATIFPHFCGGETFQDCLPIIHSLFIQYGITTILDYSCEDTIDTNQMIVNTKDKIHLLQQQLSPSSSSSNHQIRSNSVKFVPLKCTSILSHRVLEQITQLLIQKPTLIDEIDENDPHRLLLSSLSKEIGKEWLDGYQRMVQICEIGIEQQKISLLLDAEQSHRQPAVELLYRFLSLRFNQQHRSDRDCGYTPLLFNTYQCYLTRSSRAILRDYEFCRKCQLVFAVKLVRGAYMKSEDLYAKQHSQPSPIYSRKEDTDQNYNQMIDFLFQQIGSRSSSLASPSISVLFATHNRQSLHQIIEKMKQYNVPKQSSSVSFAQILGMTDNLTIGLAREGYNVSKLVLFGKFEELMPWMIRRLEENQDSLGGLHSEANVIRDAFFLKLKQLVTFQEEKIFR